MAIEYLGLSEINGLPVVPGGVQNTAYDGIVETAVIGSLYKVEYIIEIYRDRAIIQVLEGTDGIVSRNTHTRPTGYPMEVEVFEEMPGRTSNGIGQSIDGLGNIIFDMKLGINRKSLNPVVREYSRDYIRTGTSVTSGLTTLIRGQKLPTFSGNGLPHDQLAAQTVQQASLGENSNEEFAIVLGAMNVKYDAVDLFRYTFEENGVSEYAVMFINLANDSVMGRLIALKAALTLAEHLAFEKGICILVILADMTSYTEAMREVSSSKGEIPSRKGFPGYLYSDLASLYKGAGIVAGRPGSVARIPILTMSNGDTTHPVPDLTGYITEGQVVLGRQLNGQNTYPPINVLLSLSRPMKGGIGEGYTRASHQDVTNQLFSCHTKVGDTRALVSAIGKGELLPIGKKYLEFGEAFEECSIGQIPHKNRTILDTLGIGWKLLGMLPREELDRTDTKVLDQYYKPVDTVKE